MNQTTTRPESNRLTLLCLLVLSGLLVAVICPREALAANVSNPDPGLIARWEPCEPNTGVTVIVDDRALGEGKIYVGCALGEQANGVEALENAGFALEGTADYGLAFICRIDGEPTFAEQTCEQTPGAGAYWSYWHGKPGGRWDYSGVGAYAYKPALGTVEGWGFAGGPRIEPMDGRGPSSFTLPPEQESSVIPARLAREWLAPVLDQTAVQTEEDEIDKKGEEFSGLKTVLRGAVALAQAGVETAELAPIAHWLSRTCEEAGTSVGSCVLRGFAEPRAPRENQYPARFAVAILGLQALGENPSSFDGEDLRGTLEGMIEEANGKVEDGGQPSKAVIYLAPTVLALARTGPLPAKASKTIDLLLADQNARNGSFELETSANVEAIEALVAAREKGVAVLGQSRLEAIEAALAKAGDNLESLQEPDGGVRAVRGHEEAEPTVESTALGAVGLALAGHSAAAERAAKWVSPYQVTAEYAGTGNTETGEHTPAEAVIGAFTEGEAALRQALAYGIGSEDVYGVYGEAQAPTIGALRALSTAGPYGPYDASFDQQSLFFENRTVGSPSGALTATLTNDDVRQITIAEVSLTGAQAGDFSIRGGTCAGRTLTPGESCETSVSFDPTTTGEREALVHVTVQGTSQTIDLPLTGTGVAATEPPPGSEPAHHTEPEHRSEPEHHAEQQPMPPGPEPQPAGESAHQAVPAVSVAAFKSTRTVERARIATIAILRCAQGPRCTVDAPRRVRVRIAGRSYWATVLAPRELSAGQKATLAVRLSRKAYAALAGHTATITVTVALSEQSTRTTRTVQALIAHAGSAKARRTHRPDMLAGAIACHPLSCLLPRGRGNPVRLRD